jgi:hypothetical protein
VTEQELGRDENYFRGPAPIVGDVINVRCHGRNFNARVVWGKLAREKSCSGDSCAASGRRDLAWLLLAT